MPPSRLIAPILLVLIALVVSPVLAQEGAWRVDFNAAREEARVKRRPIVLDFGAANCFWCKKLDQTTFRDPQIAKRLAEQFVAVKIDADKDSALAQNLGITGYPTLVFASPDGVILGKHAGFVDAARFQQQLDRALQECRSPAKDIAAMPKETPLNFAQPVMQAAAIDPREKPNPLLVQIRADYAARQYVRCLETCKELAAVNPASPDAAEARRLADDIRSDPVKNSILQASLMETLGDLYLASAETALRQGRSQDAAEFFERVQQVCPGSPQALAAKHQDLQLRSKLSAQPIFRMQAP